MTTIQVPTLRGVRVRSAADTRRIFYAVHQRRLPIITRRLSTEERLQIRPGDVYVWEEKTQHSVDQAGLAIERWTDCFGWGPSRVREEFLFYRQKDRESKRNNNRNDTPQQAPGEHWQKQTISMTVRDPSEPSAPPRKWHMTAYFYLDDLPDVAETLNAMHIAHPPEGMFTRMPHRRNRQNQQQHNAAVASRESGDEEEEGQAGPSRRRGCRPAAVRATAAPYPALNRPARRLSSPSPSTTSTSSPSSSHEADELRSNSRTPLPHTPSSVGKLPLHSALPPMNLPSHLERVLPFRDHLPSLASPSSVSSSSARSFGSERPTASAPTPAPSASRTPEYVMALPDPERFDGRRMVLGVPVQTFVAPRRREDDEVLRKFN